MTAEAGASRLDSVPTVASSAHCCEHVRDEETRTLKQRLSVILIQDPGFPNGPP